MKRLIILAGVLTACVAPDASVRALQNQGFTNIETKGWQPFTCAESDTFSTGFTATNPQGRRVGGVVCCGVLKNCTVRF